MAVELPPTLSELADRAEPQRLRLVVILGETVKTHLLPESGHVTIGRSEENEIAVDDPLISRTHAALHLDGGTAIEIEDLASANGTRVRQAALAPNMRVSIAPGDVIDIGSTMLIVQRAPDRPLRARLWSHGYFEVRLEEECARNAQGTRSPFALIRVQVEGRAARAEETLLQAALTSSLRSSDVIACHAPGSYELLLFDSSRVRSERIAAKIKETLAEDYAVRAAIACYPDDGLTPDELMLSASLGEAVGGREPPRIVVEDGAMKELYRLVTRIAPGTISVLLLGETGVGKEVVADAIHQRSARAGQRLVRLNCAALSETLVESELFGHEKGAFTGADRAKEGLLEAANGGTVFLDEIGELPLGTQAKLLRVLEQREVLRVGSLSPRGIDVRFVSATNRNLDEEIARGKFRQDLYFRLNGISLAVPPLRERVKEIEPLALSFVAAVSRSMGFASIPSLSPAALRLLESYRWPGNIRELRNVIERAVLLCASEVIEPEHLPIDKLTVQWSARPAPVLSRELSAEERADREQIVALLDRFAGNQTRVAEELGVSRQTLSKRIDRFEIPRPRKREG